MTPTKQCVNKQVSSLSDYLHRYTDSTRVDDDRRNIPSPPCNVYFRDMPGRPFDLAGERCAVAQSTILELIAQHRSGGEEDLFLLFASDSSLVGGCCGERGAPDERRRRVRRLMTGDVLEGWFERRQATRGGRGFFDHLNRQPLESIGVYLIDPRGTPVNDVEIASAMVPLCSIDLVWAEEDAAEEAKERVRKRLRNRYTIIKLLGRSFARGSQKGGKACLIENFLATALLIKARYAGSRNEREVQMVAGGVSDGIIMELERRYPDMCMQALASLASKLERTHAEIARLATQEATRIRSRRRDLDNVGEKADVVCHI